MRIGTWNVEYAYTKRLDALRGMIASHPADIWVLTETHDDLAPIGCPHAVHAKPRPKNWSGIRPGSRWVSIWSAFPIVEQVFVDAGDEERTVIAMIDAGARGRVLVYGTVLPWKGDRGKFDWSEHHTVVPQQCNEWRELRQRYPEVALCIAGDYNTDMGRGGYYGTREGIAMLSAGLADCDLYCATTPERIPSGLLEYPPIDHIALPLKWRDQIDVTAAWPAQKGVLSDHGGLVVNIRD